jgi:hypothetical protein
MGGTCLRPFDFTFIYPKQKATDMPQLRTSAPTPYWLFPTPFEIHLERTPTPPRKPNPLTTNNLQPPNYPPAQKNFQSLATQGAPLHALLTSRKPPPIQTHSLLPGTPARHLISPPEVCLQVWVVLQIILRWVKTARKWAAVGAGIHFELEQGTGQARAFVFDTERSSCSALRRGCFEKLFFAR